MRFFQRMVGSEPIETILLGEYNYMSLKEPKEFKGVITKI